MDLKSKRVVGIAQVLMFAAMLILYTRIGSLGMICVAASMELFFVITYGLLGGVPDAMEQMVVVREKKGQPGAALRVRKAGILYTVLAAVAAEGLLALAVNFVSEQTELVYVDKLLELLMIAVPFIAVLQLLRGLLQVDLDRVVVGISRLVFVIFMIIGLFGSYMILNGYGNKVAALMSGIRKWHFYVVLGLVPGVILGAVGSIIFLAVIGFMRKEQIKLLHQEQGRSSENIFKLCGRLFVSQLSQGAVSFLTHIPVILLLWLSVGEIAKENYLFGNFYGAVLPLFGLVWSLSDLGLVTYKKRLYVAYRKRLDNQFYKDFKAVLCYVALHSMAILVLTLALHKSYLAIWSQQTFVPFMELMAASAVIGALGLPYKVLMDVLRYRGLQIERVVSIAVGLVFGILSAVICYRTIGVGTLMYVLSISLFLLGAAVVALWNLSVIIGIDYLSVGIRCAGVLIFTVILGGLAFVAQLLLFTALGGLTTLLVCVVFGMVLQLMMVLLLKVFTKEELAYLPLSFFTGKLL